MAPPHGVHNASSSSAFFDTLEPLERSYRKTSTTRQSSLPSPVTSGDDSPPQVCPEQTASDLAAQGLSSGSTPLELYIPVGCLIVNRSKIQDSVCTPGRQKWNEIHHRVPTLLEGALTLPADVHQLTRGIQELLRATWIRVTCLTSLDSSKSEIWRFYILPHDVARASVGRENVSLRSALDLLLPLLSVTSIVWHGQCQTRIRHLRNEENTGLHFDLWADGLRDSLFYLFNTIPSPDPSPQLIKNHYLRKSVGKLLDVAVPVWGLNPKTELYPFQRRSAAMMIQREVAPQRESDPRLDQRVAPTGQIYYYCGRDRQFLRETRCYDTVRGGILAESMGHGKTLICLAVILTTKGQIPCIPPQHMDAQISPREKVGTLMDMAAAATVRSQASWGAELEKQKGTTHLECIRTIERNLPFYEIQPERIRNNRSSSKPTLPEKVYLFRGTLIVVPPNLVKQWVSELEKHVAKGFLSVLVMDSLRSKLPAQAELATYDIVLFSKNRFEKEAKSNDTKSQRSLVKNRLWRKAESDNEKDYYVSPLKGVHWLRIIIDEGHAFSNSGSEAASFATTLLAERRWVVSGTPAKDLLGVDAEVRGDTVDEMEAARQTALQQRREFDYNIENKSGAVKAIGALASSFLHAQPWFDDRSAIWDEYVYRHQAFGKGKRTYTCFSWCLRHTIENLVIKTQPGDVERDIILPPINQRIVKLEPCVYDKLTANQFVLQFTANAVTSERVDIDYLFHRASRQHLVQLVKNLRLSAFTWSGFNTAHVMSSLRETEKYLAKEDAHCSKDDRKLLIDTANEARIVLQLACWKAITEKALLGVHEIGVMLESWPEGSQDIWALDHCANPMVMDLGRLIKAQVFINGRLALPDPADGLAGVGIRVTSEEAETVGAPSVAALSVGALSVVALSDAISVESDRVIVLTSSGTMQSKTAPVKHHRGSPHIRKRRPVKDTHLELSADTPLARTRLVGTISTKFSYIISRILDLYEDHKCLIFYDANHIAGFLGEAFELLHIKHLIYTGDIPVDRRARYIELFNTDPSQRVLLMDLKQAAHGLNITSAARIFFVNPVCRPNIEAQAIKRAHRIGQTQPVYVETLVLRGTVEEAMQDRASKMTAGQHLAAKTLEDDAEIRTILQEARVFHIEPEELVGHGCMAPLAVPQQIFGRPGRAPQKSTALEVELFGDEEKEDDGDDGGEERAAPRRRMQLKRKRVEKNRGDDEGGECHDAIGPAGEGSSMEGYTSLFGGHSSENVI